MDVGVIMDRSGSVGSANFQKAREFVTKLVQELQISSHGTRVGIIAYHSSSSLVVNFANHAAQEPNAMAAKIRGIHYSGGGTRTDKALELANTHLFTNAGGDRADKPNVLILMSDGKTNSGSKPYSQVLAPLLVSKAAPISTIHLCCMYYRADIGGSMQRAFETHPGYMVRLLLSAGYWWKHAEGFRGTPWVHGVDG